MLLPWNFLSLGFLSKLRKKILRDKKYLKVFGRHQAVALSNSLYSAGSQVARSSSTPNWLPRSRFQYDKCRLVDKVFHFLSRLLPSTLTLQSCARVQWTFLLSTVRSHDEIFFGKGERNSVLFVSVFTFLCRLSQSLGHASGHEYNYLRKLMTIEADKSCFGSFRLATGLFWASEVQSEIPVSWFERICWDFECVTTFEPFLVIQTASEPSSSLISISLVRERHSSSTSFRRALHFPLASFSFKLKEK